MELTNHPSSPAPPTCAVKTQNPQTEDLAHNETYTSLCNASQNLIFGPPHLSFSHDASTKTATSQSWLSDMGFSMIASWPGLEDKLLVESFYQLLEVNESCEPLYYK